MHVRRGAAPVAASLALGVATLALPLLSAPSHPAAAAAPVASFQRVATYPVFQNLPAGTDPASTAVAEISAVSEDGRTVGYTDSAGRIGFVDITDPAAPVGLGTIPTPGGSPTSIAFYGGYMLAVVDTSTYPEDGSAVGERSGRLDVIRVSDRSVVRTIDLGGQPDSIAISSNGPTRYAAIAIENQRNEDFTPDGLAEGDLPQAPAGFVQTIELDPDPAAWAAAPILLPEAALTAAVGGPLAAPSDPEPEYVAINSAGKLAVTLQENNGVVVIDLATRAIEHVYNAGTVALSGIDTKKDKLLDYTGTQPALPREPDAVAWIDDDHFATANEGDWKGGTRGFTVFDASDGSVVWDAGNTFEHLAATLGLTNDDRNKKGTEPEGLAFAEFGGTPYLFVGSERSDFVGVYDVTDPARPAYVQALPTTNGPEGLLPIPSRDLFVTSSETDDASVLVRASVGIYRFGPGAPVFPTIHSETADAGDLSSAPLGWGALGALSADPVNPHVLWTASDAAYTQGRIYRVDVAETPALITGVRIVHHADGSKPALDVEGIAARPDGGFWLASEGATGAANKLVRTDRAGLVLETVDLPTAVTDHVKNWGLEGVTTVGTGAAERVYVALQRPLWTDASKPAAELTTLEGNVTRIGRYTPATHTWDWFGYPLGTTSVAGDWLGVSEITAVDADTLALVERDKQNGTTAAVKRVYTVDVPAGAGATGVGPVKVLPKTLALDVLPALRAFHGWTQEKLEGLTIGGDGRVYAVTDNDGLKDATGETQFLRLGAATSVFAHAFPKPQPQPQPPAARAATTTRLSAPRSVRAGRAVRVTVRLTPAAATGSVVVRDHGRVIARVALRHGVARLSRRLAKGTHRLRATYVGSATYLPSSSARITVRVR